VLIGCEAADRDRPFSTKTSIVLASPSHLATPVSHPLKGGAGANDMGKVSVVGFSVTAALVFGCGGAGEGANAAAGEGPGDAGPVIAVEGYVRASDGTGLGGADICMFGQSADPGPCAKSDASGAFTLAGLPANELLSLAFDKNGYVPMLRTVLTEEQDVHLPERENTLVAATQPESFLGVPADPTKGQIAFQVQNADGNAPDVDVALTGFDGATVPAALSSDGTPAGSFAAGSGGGFANLAPGTYVLRVGGAFASCTSSALYGMPITTSQPSEAAALAVSVAAGYVSAPVVVSCTRLAQ
jgi:hypothetical protein